MPELPEVEVTKQGIEPKILGREITAVNVYDGRLRWPVPTNLQDILLGERCFSIVRRGKYLILAMRSGYLLIHLGMTGVLRVLSPNDPRKIHDRVEIIFGDRALRLHDPRKFGAILWHAKTDGPVEQHPLLLKLGLEPLEADFSGDQGGKHLFQASRGKKLAVKQFLLAGHAVVGVGNIYCSESLFEAKISPLRAAGKVSLKRYQDLAEAIRHTLEKAIKAGGSSLKDFVDSEGQPGHFMLQTKAYGRAGEPCLVCGKPIAQITQGQRSTYYCSTCQK